MLAAGVSQGTARAILLPRPIGQGLCAQRNEKFLWGLKLAPNFAPPPHWEKWRFGCLGRFRKNYHCKYQNPSSPHQGKWRFGYFGRFRKFNHCKYQNLMHTRCQYKEGAVAWEAIDSKFEFQSRNLLLQVISPPLAGKGLSLGRSLFWDYEVDAVSGPLQGFLAAKYVQCAAMWNKKFDVKTLKVFTGFSWKSYRPG